MPDREQPTVDGGSWSYRYAEKTERKLMVAHCIEDLLGIAIEAWSVGESRRQNFGAILGRLKNLRLKSHEITPAYGSFNWTIKYFFQLITAMVFMHCRIPVSEEAEPLDGL